MKWNNISLVNCCFLEFSDSQRMIWMFEECQIADLCLDLYKEYGTTMAGLKVTHAVLWNGMFGKMVAESIFISLHLITAGIHKFWQSSCGGSSVGFTRKRNGHGSEYSFLFSLCKMVTVKELGLGMMFLKYEQEFLCFFISRKLPKRI